MNWYLTKEEYVDCIIADQFLDEIQISNIMALGKQSSMEKGGVTKTGVDLDKVRRSEISWIKTDSNSEWLYELIGEHVKFVNERFFNFDLTYLAGLQFTKYDSKQSGFYAKHTDMFRNTSNIREENRKLSFSIQLSNPNEYDGGDLILHHGADPDVVPRAKGTVVFFPSYMLHEVTPVTRGTRYSLVGWVHGPKFR